MAVLLVAAACGGMRGRPAGPPGRAGATRPVTEREQNVRFMLALDQNKDGIVTREEVEAAMRREFAAADTNGDGRIDRMEMQAENDRRFRANGTGASPLIDWNQDGVIDYNEFATTTRSLFAELDRDSDGRLDATELRLPMVRVGRGMPRGPADGQGAPPRLGASPGLSK